MSSELTIRIESVAEVWEEVDTLARKEHAEMEVGWREYAPDWKSFMVLEKAGTFKGIAARKDGKMIGYFSWMVDFDLESKGTLIAHQCAWYVEPGHFGVAVRMFNWAMKEFERLGIKFVYLHNAARGRGKTLGRFFEKNGAHHCSNTYVLRL